MVLESGCPGAAQPRRQRRRAGRGDEFASWHRSTSDFRSSSCPWSLWSSVTSSSAQRLSPRMLRRPLMRLPPNERLLPANRLAQITLFAPTPKRK